MSKYKNRQKFGNVNSFTTVYEIQDFIISRTEAGTACPSRTYAFTAGFMTGSVLLIFLGFFCVTLLCVITFWVLCCDICYDFPHLTIFGSSLPPVVCRRVHVLFTFCVFACAQWCPMHTVLCFCFVFLCLVYPMFLWIVYFCLTFRYSLMFFYTIIN